jgi:hypothetical protein
VHLVILLLESFIYLAVTPLAALSPSCGILKRDDPAGIVTNIPPDVDV